MLVLGFRFGLRGVGLGSDPLTGQQQRVRGVRASLPLHPQDSGPRIHDPSSG